MTCHGGGGSPSSVYWSCLQCFLSQPSESQLWACPRSGWAPAFPQRGCLGLWSQSAWVQIPALALMGDYDLGESFNLLQPQLPSLYNGAHHRAN